MTTKRTIRSGAISAAPWLALALITGPAFAAVPTDAIVAQAQHSRDGAGLQVSSWQPDEPTGFANTNTASFHGYFTKGLDQHLAWENTLGYWGARASGARRSRSSAPRTMSCRRTSYP
jgi:hypothetical protein